MSIQFAQGKLKGEERKEIIRQVQKQLQEAAVRAISPLMTSFLEAEVTAKLGREKGSARRVSSQVQEIDWQCGYCGCRDANQFTRDGHYRRSLQTGWGSVEGLQVPMLECQGCGHDVICRYAILEKYERFWLDLDQQVLFGSGFCQSLRQLSEHWSAILGSSVGLRTINERINQLESLLAQGRRDPISDVPAVVQFDGIWLRVQTQTQTVKVDKRQRKRRQRTGKKVVLLVALGFWNDGSGKREIVDWEVADGEGKAAWERFVQRLWDRGVQPEKGLQAVIRDGNGELGEALALVYGTTVLEQRCIFHKLRNVADKCRQDLKGKGKKEERQRLLEQARAIYQAENAEAARTRLGEFTTTWRERAPKAVATLQRDFEQTIAYYRLEGTARELIRTTSLLERTNRELRRKFRQACCFSSCTGAQVAIYLQVKRLNASWSKEKQTWWQIAQALSFDLLTLDP
jgi:putative transposase